MKCKDVQLEIALDSSEEFLIRSGIRTHLDGCPLCRVALDEHRQLALDLQMSVRPKLDLSSDRLIRNAIKQELRNGKSRASWLSTGFGEWTQMRLMPLAIGTVSSLLIGLGVLSFLFSTLNNPVTMKANDVDSVYGDSRTMVAAGKRPISDANAIFPADYARNRLAVANESPSINPQGSLVSLTGSSKLDRATTDGVVVVAEVFSDGLARVQEVVSPNSSSRELEDLERALDAELGDAPFVPASLDGRSNSVRVVLRFQHVNVNVNSRTVTRRKR